MKIILWILAFLVLFFLYVRYIERHSIFFPFKEIQATPEFIGLAYEEVYFETEDKKRLHGWFIPKDNSDITILFFHGNAGNIGDRLGKITAFNDWGFNIFIFDYRGYGKSKGLPSELGLYKDARAAYSYITEKRKIQKEEIVFYGESLGGAVLLDLAEHSLAKAIITEDTFTSVRDMARVAYPFIPGFMLSNKFDSVSKIKNIDLPKLIIHSVNDEIVPFYLGERLFNAAKPPKEMLKIRGLHNTAFFDSAIEVREGIAAFFKRE